MHKIISDLYKTIQNQMKREAQQNMASQMGQITGIGSGRRYDITTSDGAVYRSVSSIIPTTTFTIGTWVIFEWSGSDWQIVGYSGSAASN